MISDPAESSAILSPPTLRTALGIALDCGQFTLHYQPQADLSNGRIHAVEALLR